MGRKSSVMPFKKFKYIMKQIQQYEKKRDKISDFFEDEICTDSWCYINFGENIVDTLVCLLADHFNCWYQINWNPSIDTLKNEFKVNVEKKKESHVAKWWDKSLRRWENDIEYFLYEENKQIIINGEEVPIKTLNQFYKYLVKYCVDKKDI